jgi:hypothetical protein
VTRNNNISGYGAILRAGRRAVKGQRFGATAAGEATRLAAPFSDAVVYVQAVARQSSAALRRAAPSSADVPPLAENSLSD